VKRIVKCIKRRGVISFKGVLGAKTLILLALRLIPSAAAMPPAAAALPAMAPRIDLLECLADVFVGGVLYTHLAWVMGNQPFMVRVRAGAEGDTSPRLDFVLALFHGKVN
jgi:hypothetical protein